MHHRFNDILGFSVCAIDGELGRLTDLYYEEKTLKIRYLVVDTEEWLNGRRILINPVEIGYPGWNSGKIPVLLTRNQVKHAPQTEPHKPVSREYEIELARYYQWVPYWRPVQPISEPAPDVRRKILNRPRRPAHPLEKPFVKSIRDSLGCKVRAADGYTGTLIDGVIETESWNFKYCVADLSGLMPGKHTLIPAVLIDNENRKDNELGIIVEAEKIRKSPGYDSGKSINREYEMTLLKHYGR